MDWLNYHHLFYFYTAAKEGGITAASKRLRLAQPTVSGQIRQLEEAVGSPLFARNGRGVELTEAGRVAYRYACEIFDLGTEFLDVMQGRQNGRPSKLLVGIADVLPKLLVHRFVEPALGSACRVICKQDSLDSLLGSLSTHALDLVLADSPISPTVSVKAFNHLLGESKVSVFAHPKLARKLQKGFPGSLNRAPFLLPGEHTVLRSSLEQWFQRESVRPDVAAEFDDSALMKTFGQIGVGAFAAPTAVKNAVEKQYGVKAVGQLDGIRERFYAITVERRLKHPGALAISKAAQGVLL